MYTLQQKIDEKGSKMLKEASVASKKNEMKRIRHKWQWKESKLNLKSTYLKTRVAYYLEAISSSYKVKVP